MSAIGRAVRCAGRLDLAELRRMPFSEAAVRSGVFMLHRDAISGDQQGRAGADRCLRIYFFEIVLRIIRTPRTDLETSFGCTSTDVVNGW
jgi:hypothetical protein